MKKPKVIALRVIAGIVVIAAAILLFDPDRTFQCMFMRYKTELLLGWMSGVEIDPLSEDFCQMTPRAVPVLADKLEGEEDHSFYAVCILVGLGDEGLPMLMHGSATGRQVFEGVSSMHSAMYAVIGHWLQNCTLL